MNLHKRFALKLFVPLFLIAGPVMAETMQVYKSPTCGCCTGWVKHMENAGYDVIVHHVENVNPIKEAHGLPPALASCHTAIINGYLFEGHVPASDIKRFLQEKPHAKGLAVPGMPAGENVPGMEVAGRRASFASYLIPEQASANSSEPIRSSDIEVFDYHR